MELNEFFAIYILLYSKNPNSRPLLPPSSSHPFHSPFHPLLYRPYMARTPFTIPGDNTWLSDDNKVTMMGIFFTYQLSPSSHAIKFSLEFPGTGTTVFPLPGSFPWSAGVRGTIPFFCLPIIIVLHYHCLFPRVPIK